jgi:hypothetical protein
MNWLSKIYNHLFPHVTGYSMFRTTCHGKYQIHVQYSNDVSKLYFGREQEWRRVPNFLPVTRHQSKKLERIYIEQLQSSLPLNQ